MTTTLAAIKNNWETLFNALTPADASTLKFAPAPRDEDHEEWALEYVSSCTRRYSFDSGTVENGEWHHPSQHWRQEEVLVTISYFKDYFKEAQGLEDARDVIRADAALIADTIFNSDNYISGQDGPQVQIEPLDRTDDKVWFQTISVLCRYKETRN